MRMRKDADEQICAEEEDQEDERNEHPAIIAGAVRRKDVMGGTNKLIETVDVPDHEGSTDYDKRSNHAGIHLHFIKHSSDRR